MDKFIRNWFRILAVQPPFTRCFGRQEEQCHLFSARRSAASARHASSKVMVLSTVCCHENTQIKLLDSRPKNASWTPS